MPTTHSLLLLKDGKSYAPAIPDCFHTFETSFLLCTGKRGVTRRHTLETADVREYFIPDVDRCTVTRDLKHIFFYFQVAGGGLGSTPSARIQCRPYKLLAVASDGTLGLTADVDCALLTLRKGGGAGAAALSVHHAASIPALAYIVEGGNSCMRQRSMGCLFIEVQDAFADCLSRLMVSAPHYQ